MKEKLVALAWICSKCLCTGQQGYDFAHPDFKGEVISIRRAGRSGTFRIVKNSLVLEKGSLNYLIDKMQKHDMLSLTVPAIP